MNQLRQKINSLPYLKLMFLLYILIILVINANFFVEQVNKLEVDEVSPKTFISNRNYTYENKEVINQQKEDLLANKPLYYEYNNQSELNITSEIETFNAHLSEIKQIKDSVSSEQLYLKLKDYASKNNLEYNYVLAINNSISELSTDNMNNFKDRIVSFVVKDNGVTLETLDSRKQEMEAYIDTFFSHDILKLHFTNIVDTKLEVNKTINETLTNQVYESELLKIAEENTEYLKSGQKIVEQGAILTERDINIINGLNLTSTSNNLEKYLKINIILFFFMIAIYLLAQHMKHKVFENKNKMHLLMVLFLVSHILISLTIAFSLDNHFIVLLLPLVIIITDIFISKRIAILTSVLYGIEVGLLTSNLLLTLISLVTSLVIALSILGINNRDDITKSSIITSLIVILLTYLIDINNTLNGVDYIIILLNVVTSYFLFNQTSSLIERFFDILTPFKLLELQKHPLINRLILEAPGTYAHSLNVATLARNAALKVGANDSLIYIGGLLHDIGKLSNPIMFTENHTHFGISSNPHNRLLPNESAEIIRNHVRYGMELAEENKLPLEVQNFIRTHHGTSTIKYFYFKAKEKVDNEDDINVDDFMYLWGKPLSKEEGIMMLCDVAEAVSKSFDSSDREYIAEHIPKYLNQVISEGQLDKCNLTLREISLIQESIIDTLVSLNLKRTKYQNQKD